MKSIEYLDKYIVYENGEIYSKKYKRFLKTRINHNGYTYVKLNYKQIRLHRLIALLFIDNPLNKKCVNHINGLKSDNYVSNLEWCTHSENNKHAYRIGLKKPTPRLNNKIVINTITKQLYNSAKEVLPLTNLKYNSFTNRLNGVVKNDTIYEYYKTPN
jgi:hypothetical protein